MAEHEAYTDNLSHLHGALQVLNLRLHRQVLRWRATHHDEATGDELLGRVLSDREVDRMLDQLYARRADAHADASDRRPLATLTALVEAAEAAHRHREQAAGVRVDLRLPRLCRQLGLDEFAQQVLLLTLAPEIDRGYERIFACLDEDVTRRGPTVGLALELFCADPRGRARRRSAFSPTAPLGAFDLVRVTEDGTAREASLRSRGIRLDDAVADHLLGSDTPDPALRGVAELRFSPPAPPPLDPEPAAQVADLAVHLAWRPDPAPLVVLSGTDGDALVDVARHLAGAWRRDAPLLVVDASVLAAEPEPGTLSSKVWREARLRGAVVALRDPPHAAVAAGFLDGHDDRPGSPPCFVLAGQSLSLRRPPSTAPLVHVHVPPPGSDARRRLWREAVGDDVDVTELADRFRLTVAQISAAADRARSRAAMAGGTVGRAELFAACRAEGASDLAGLAERIDSRFGWEDLVVPASVMGQLLAVQRWVEHQGTVYGTWGFRERVAGGRGLTALFAGPSGTGKTMAAGILARELGLDLYRVDLSTVVSKYIGETEKNLSRVFGAAEATNAILLFDEADALFGKRSEVKDAHDRYANIEVSYLLQRMEAYDGVAILASNLRDNLDAAFARRIHHTIEFPLPQAPDRERIWRALLPAAVPQAGDVDLGFLARRFPLTGGHIRNCALAAAFTAAADGGTVRMAHLVRAVARELDKTGQPLVRSDFGAHYDVIRQSPAGGGRP